MLGVFAEFETAIQSMALVFGAYAGVTYEHSYLPDFMEALFLFVPANPNRRTIRLALSPI
jgi:hypothetical protein